MSADLERRRLAIAQAFREAKISPAPPPRPVVVRDDGLTRRVGDVERAIADVRIQVADVTRRLDTLVAEANEDESDPDSEESDSRTAVPPLELAGLMSPVASRALFGHP